MVAEDIKLSECAMHTHRHCPYCDEPTVCMKKLANDGETLCRHCYQRIRVNPLMKYSVPPLMVVCTFLLFQFKIMIAGTVLFFPTIIMIAGWNIIAVRWFVLSTIADDDFPPPAKAPKSRSLAGTREQAAGD